MRTSPPTCDLHVMLDEYIYIYIYNLKAPTFFFFIYRECLLRLSLGFYSSDVMKKTHACFKKKI